MLVVLVAIALLATFYGVDTRDSRDWRAASHPGYQLDGLGRYRA